MKVLFLGHYKDDSGWANAAINQILALDKAGVEVVPRAIKLNTSQPKVPERILELESKSVRGADVVIQHILPHHMEYNGHLKNVAYCYYEMAGATRNAWPTMLNEMDAVWTSSKFSADCIRSMGVTKDIDVIPFAFDMSKYDKKYKNIGHPEIDGNIVFYTIADLNKRKDFFSLIYAFHRTFTPNMPVKLLIKTSKYGLTGEACYKIVMEEVNRIKHGMKLHQRIEHYTSDIIIPDFVSDDEVMQIHNSCDVFVTTSHGEAWCLPLFDAQAVGNVTVAPRGQFDFHEGLEFHTIDTPVFNMNDSFFELSNGLEDWKTADMNSLCHCLDVAYKMASGQMKKPPKGSLDEYTLESVGSLLKQKLETL